MKKIIIIGFLIVCNLSCKAQSIVPIEKLGEYMREEKDVPESVTYLKDVNGIRDKYVGTWRGTYNGRNYEVTFTKKVTTYDGLTEDRLAMRYLITDTSGAVLEDTRAESDDSPYTANSYYFDKTYFVLTYEGRQTQCGQGGELFVLSTKNTNNTTIELFLTPRQDFILDQYCPNGPAPQLFPKTKMTLTKQ
ncbi:hypothetical protein OIU80_20620 [Flavobacterium sp. LS1R47]|uniref:DUF6705 domain-containing protein n=1 Tax=Flavobacterium frigoritolerans TaxID=2987686 RepID=A0A9X3CAS5_9FLAO|nr:DUF6705 family protein [Flavobacterium frigoritolerans]MCV9934692.1 hypothetical protein [Flavobacterium frigoritolerans]